MEINLRRYLKYGLHCVDFYGTRSDAIQFCGNPMYQTISHLKEKRRKCRQSFFDAPSEVYKTSELLSGITCNSPVTCFTRIDEGIRKVATARKLLYALKYSVLITEAFFARFTLERQGFVNNTYLYFYSKSKQIHNISNSFYFGTTLYMFRSLRPSLGV
jgi:hypothetical protein